MSIIASSNFFTARKSRSQYQIERSLRFNSADSTNLTRNIATTGNRRTFTISFWFKSVVSNSAGGFVATDGNILTSGYIEFQLTNSDKLQFRYSTGNARSTTAVFRDPSAWYHIVFAVDTTQATDTNRIRVYVNGTEYATTGDAYPAQNFDTFFNTAGIAAQIGHNRNSSGTPENYLSGYIAEYNHIDGQQLTPSSFGETDTITGVWKPKKYTGTYGTNGFYLKFADNSGTTAATLGKDSSGNGNNWTPNNFTNSGFTSDCMVDTPTSNYTTMNPLANASSTSTVGNGMLEVADTSAGGSWEGCQATIPFPTTGKWYYEMRMGGGTNNIFFGISSDAGRYATIMHTHADSFCIRQSDCFPQPDGASTTGTKSGYGHNDIAGIAVNCDTGVIQFYKNNSLNVTFSTTFDPAKTYFASFMSSATGTQTMDFNFGAGGFTYTPPSGFLALNTQNLPEPSIKKGSSYMDVVLYTGNATARSITGLGFSPDLVWIKDRTGDYHHGLFDVVRGANLRLSSSTTGSENTHTQSLTAFNSGGFSLGDNSDGNNAVNINNHAYVAWCWDESATPGFDIVTYAGNGASPRSINHSLGVAPSFVVVKNRTTAGYEWPCFHTSLGTGKVIWLHLDYEADLITNRAYGGIDSVSSTTFTVKSGHTNGGNVNANGDNYVAYLWSEVAGFSKFGSYTGNGSSDGPFVFCGFRPRWVMIKASTSNSRNWGLVDSTRSYANVANHTLAANRSDGESYYGNGESVFGSFNKIDLLSNGFKPRENATWANGSGETYIFAAYAESPFKYALAR